MLPPRWPCCSSAVLTTVYCDHRIWRALSRSTRISTTCEVRVLHWFLETGVIHYINLENYAFPGGLMIDTGSHTPNAASGRSLSCAGMATIRNMNVEIGATTSMFPFNRRMVDYLDDTKRQDIAKYAHRFSHNLQADKNVEYGQFAAAVKENNWPEELKVALIGSGTNSSYEDMSRLASIATKAASRGSSLKSKFTVTPGSEQVGGLVPANACGPCIGQWDRTDVAHGEATSINTSYNRNLTGCNTFNPMTDSLAGADGKPFKFSDPSGNELPHRGSQVQVAIDPKSDRLQLLTAFEKWDGKTPRDIPILIKVTGKCTTDHISAGGPWLNEANKIKNQVIGEFGAVLEVGAYYRDNEIKWVVIDDHNYGEGSSREHAPLEPRYLDGLAIIIGSFARIHETNLKKQGMLALRFLVEADYDKFNPSDKEIKLAHSFNQDQIEWFKAGSGLNLMAAKANQ
ncbi:aconitase iron-sulfur domain-containing protein [Athelia psychrophila]|uniref:Aconitate hydratase, mitochondrial n=1 Tax=Athelia psychrophila TaxID=1759441 RepID=A0A167W8H8_9AGAM|nr:aconitase iron-sulfur domain-containing protein [Fibularhizoctonia sp. CBS 109695]